MHYTPVLVLSIITSFLFFFRGGSVFPTPCTTFCNEVLINLYYTNKAKLYNSLVKDPIKSDSLFYHLNLEQAPPFIYKTVHTVT